MLRLGGAKETGSLGLLRLLLSRGSAKQTAGLLLRGGASEQAAADGWLRGSGTTHLLRLLCERASE